MNANILWLRLTWKQKDILQKQPPGCVLQGRSSKIFAEAYKKTRVQGP